jgi:ubiquitin C-terminal hydrolase
VVTAGGDGRAARVSLFNKKKVICYWHAEISCLWYANLYCFGLYWSKRAALFLRFRNVGNCCYVNAVLRALFSLKNVFLELQAVLATVTERPLLPVIDLFQQLMLKSAKQVCQNINLSINRIFSSQKQ